MRRIPTPLAAPALALLLLASAASAQVRDDARFFNAQTVARANDTIDRVRQQYRKTVVVETYDAVPGNLQGNLQQLGRDRFYAQWADDRMRSMNLDGLLILITKNPGRIQVGLGKATPDRTFTVADREQVRKILADNFRSQQYDAGLQQAMDFVYRRMGENAGPEATAGGRTGSTSPQPPQTGGGAGGGAGSTPSRTTPLPPVGTSRSCGMGSMLCLIIGIVVVVMLVRGVFARRSAGGAGYGGGYGGPGMPPPPPGGVYGQPGYGQPGYGQPGYGGGGGGGGFGRGVLGGLLGGVLGSWGYNRMNRPPGSGQSGFDAGTGTSSSDYGLPRTDPTTFGGGGGADYSSSGSDFGGSSGSDFGGGGGGDSGGGGGGDTGGSSGSDF